MAKYGGSLERGRRLPHEVVAPPPAGDLSASERAVQAVLRDLVESVGGRFDRGPAIPLGDVGLLADYFERWASERAERRDGGRVFLGRPGFWQALDDLYPLQDPNRWDRLRQQVIAELEDRGWRRLAPPRGSAFALPD